eukprot:c9451_g1_i1.p1 GENE.c9451_g1_i1~~c9451_g1_i1.p1  ORF type:complete len:622 (+),score=124.67 c9451_g1_i1:37-1866(+)
MAEALPDLEAEKKRLISLGYPDWLSDIASTTSLWKPKRPRQPATVKNSGNNERSGDCCDCDDCCDCSDICEECQEDCTISNMCGCVDDSRDLNDNDLHTSGRLPKYNGHSSLKNCVCSYWDCTNPAITHCLVRQVTAPEREGEPHKVQLPTISSQRMGVCEYHISKIIAVSYRWADFQNPNPDVHTPLKCVTCGEFNASGGIPAPSVPPGIFWIDHVACDKVSIEQVMRSRQIYKRSQARWYFLSQVAPLSTEVSHTSVMTQLYILMKLGKMFSRTSDVGASAVTRMSGSLSRTSSVLTGSFKSMRKMFTKRSGHNRAKEILVAFISSIFLVIVSVFPFAIFLVQLALCLLIIPVASIMCVILSNLHSLTVYRSGFLVQNHLITIRPRKHADRFWLAVEDGYRLVDSYVLVDPELFGTPGCATLVGKDIIPIEHTIWRRLKWLSGSHALAWLACQRNRTLALREAADVMPALRNLLRHQILAASRGGANNGDGLNWLRIFQVKVSHGCAAEKLRLPVLTDGSVAFTELVEVSENVRWTPRLAFSAVLPIRIVPVKVSDEETAEKSQQLVLHNNAGRIWMISAISDRMSVTWRLWVNGRDVTSLRVAWLG